MNKTNCQKKKRKKKRQQPTTMAKLHGRMGQGYTLYMSVTTEPPPPLSNRGQWCHNTTKVQTVKFCWKWLNIRFA